jgi:hypothetical protein
VCKANLEWDDKETFISKEGLYGGCPLKLMLRIGKEYFINCDFRLVPYNIKNDEKKTK